MKKIITLIFMLAISGDVICAQSSVVQRKSLDPKDAATVKSLEAKKWVGFGLKQQTKDSVKSSNNIGSGVNCTTTVGNAPDPSYPHPLGNSKTQPSVVVVTGNVINVCG
ncbi:hypothetical protein RHD99_15890 [Buttiauxella selenatireducens]|uniref:Uncharacterized protein n=1 Tax=Buttiauxella selenatireducens TaxID=3073902 RepID=A0ABY9S6B3_9ENTR|nr:hypothetical protein [Buttiauxella sp. R73]WMY72942.1 hypothetical protein RHD99_15890 [Buttiauxella sp. R73]